jgi:phenylalanyl-tRNA synthetase alpha subunit
MFDSVQAVLNNHEENWNIIPIMVKLKKQFDELIQQIEKLSEEANPGTSKITTGKKVLRKVLVIKATGLSGILQSFASMKKDAALLQRVTFTKSDLNRAKEKEVAAMVRPLLSVARQHLDKLSDYGISEEILTEVETSVNNFDEVIGAPREVKNRAFSKTAAIKDLFFQTNELLRNHFDKLMIRFKEIAPVFYDEYIRARTIVD